MLLEMKGVAEIEYRDTIWDCSDCVGAGCVCWS